ncbi:MAG: hypothetical protein ACLRV9_07430, partial [Clostridium sp.]
AGVPGVTLLLLLSLIVQ